MSLLEEAVDLYDTLSELQWRLLSMVNRNLNVMYERRNFQGLLCLCCRRSDARKFWCHKLNAIVWMCEPCLSERCIQKCQVLALMEKEDEDGFRVRRQVVKRRFYALKLHELNEVNDLLLERRGRRLFWKKNVATALERYLVL